MNSSGTASQNPQRIENSAASAWIASARALFAERGYAAVDMEEIFRRAQTRRGEPLERFRGGKEELFRAVLVEVGAETARRVAGAARSRSDPWESLVAGADEFLDCCVTPELRRIVFLDAPTVLDWDIWRAVEGERGRKLVEGAFRRALDAGRVVKQPAEALAQVLLDTLHDAALVMAQAEDPAAAREEMGRSVRLLLNGLRGPSA